MIGPVREGVGSDAALVAAALAGDGRAFASLFDGWFDRCFDVAYRIVRNRDIAAEVAQEVFLGAWRDLATLRDHTAFGGWVLRTARNRALNRLERERRTVAIGDEATASAADASTPAPDAAADALAGTGDELVWAAAAALGERDASILDLHLRHGLAAPELAEALGVTANNAHQLLYRLRGKLGDAIRAFVLWHQGRPSCPELQDALHRAGLQAFGPDAAKVAQRHAESCERCGERQRLALAPEALFAGVPLALAGPELRAKVISSLRDEGVPVGAPPAPSPPPPPPPPPPGGPPLGPAAGDGEMVRHRRARRRGLVLAAVLAAILMAGGALLALGDEPPPTALDASVLGSVAGSFTSTTAPAPLSSPATGTTLAALPPASSTSAPSTQPRPTTTVPPSSTTSTTSTTAAPPAVRRFAATSVNPSGTCAKDEQQVQLAWSTTGATAVTVRGPGAPAKAQPPSGSASACAPLATASPVYVLEATGPGGTATAKDSA